ncbi:MAG: putative sulfoacetate transporter SauU [Planctomycetota bacterium]|jgi:sugar phosphate permease
MSNPFATPAGQERSSPPPPPPGGRVRWLVLTWLCALSGILYIDRICISAAISPMQAELGLTNTQISYVLMAFTLAYGLFEIPTGRWGDRIGPRRVLTRISIWWSAFTVLTGLCTGLYSLILVRFLFGAGEAGAFPNAARVVSRWFPTQERGRVQGILLAASQAGGALSPFLASWLILTVGWRSAFAVFGVLGFLWALGFYAWFRDEPDEHRSVTPEELRHIRRSTAAASSQHAAIPWTKVFSSISVILLSLIMVCASFNSYIYFSWFLRYLQAARSLGQSEAGLMSSVVLACAALGTLAGGWSLDITGAAKSPGGQRAHGSFCFLAAAALLYAALQQEDVHRSVVFTGLSCFFTQATQALWWSCAIQISGRHVGALFGLMNSVGVFGALSSQYLVGALADYLAGWGLSGRDQWDPIFLINCGVLITAAVLWALFVQRPVEETSEAE